MRTFFTLRWTLKKFSNAKLVGINTKGKNAPQSNSDTKKQP